jgi:hypothetical protein
MSEHQSFLDAARQMIVNKSEKFQAFRVRGGCKISGKYQAATLFIYYVFVPGEARNTGLLRTFFNQLHTLGINSVAVLAVQSSILDEYLQRFVCPTTEKRFQGHGGDYLIKFIHD